jgi:hypothetical protein
MDGWGILRALGGGALIGLAAIVLMLANGRIAGISGIIGGMFAANRAEIGWRLAFIGGLMVGPFAAMPALGGVPAVTVLAGVPALVIGGLLVGFGTRLGSGCTSGHGVCGLARLSRRSLVATLGFMLTGFAVVFVLRRLLAE